MAEGRVSPWIWAPLCLVPLQLWFKDASVAVVALLFVSSLVWQRANLAALLNIRAMIPWVLFGAWSLLAVSWTPSPSLASWAKPLFAVFMGIVLCRAAAQLDAPTARTLLARMAIVTCALFALLLIERITDAGLIQLYRSDASADAMYNVMRGGLVLLACATIPLAAWTFINSGKAVLPLSIGLFVFGLSLTYRMDAVPVALICGAVSFALVRFVPGLGASFIVMMTGLITLAWPLVFMAALNAGWHEWIATEVHANWGYRIAIWGRVGEMIMANPLLGYGFNAAREVGQTANLIPSADGNTTFLHPHNGFLQIWLELGLIGVVLFGFAIASSLRIAMARASTPMLEANFAALWTTVAVIWLLSYGVWQSWWIAVIGLIAALFVALSVATQEPAIDP